MYIKYIKYYIYYKYINIYMSLKFYYIIIKNKKNIKEIKPFI